MVEEGGGLSEEPIFAANGLSLVVITLLVARRSHACMTGG